jgi:hypothetical protein
MPAQSLLHMVFGRLFALLAKLADEPVSIYRPEAHYMRGPGPAWRAKHRQT